MRNALRREFAGRQVRTLSAAEAFSIALEDKETAGFLKAHFSVPELRPRVFSRRWLTKAASGAFWQIAILEKTPAVGNKNWLFTVAHVSVDATNGKILGRWFFSRIFQEEYLEFIVRSGAHPSDCKDQTR